MRIRLWSNVGVFEADATGCTPLGVVRLAIPDDPSILSPVATRPSTDLSPTINCSLIVGDVEETDIFAATTSV
jgi:hypothetical protein